MTRAVVENSLSEAITHFSTFEAFGGNGILLLTGKDHNHKPLHAVVGKVPELSIAAVKTLYNGKWRQRHIGLIFGIPQPKVSTMVNDRSVQVSRVFKQ